MIFTLEYGPFFGQEVDTNNLPETKVVGSVKIPGQAAKFVLMTYARETEPIMIGVINPDKTLRWVKSLTTDRQARVVEVVVQDSTAVRLEGYGYVLSLTEVLNSQKGRYLLYLDESLNLRFYFLYW